MTVIANLLLSRCILFRQSDIKEHTELAWIIGCQSTVKHLASLSQYKEKKSKFKDADVPLGLLTYPVLQTADILLYKATDVPVGEDNLQNIEEARHLARAFNRRFGDTFPQPEARLVDNSSVNRVRSLRDPSKKMSKSDPDQKSCIYLSDTSDEVVSKCKKAVTDSIGRVTFDLDERPGVSNLIAIHAAFTDQTPDDVCEEVAKLDTGKYKKVLAEVINEHLKPVRENMARYEKDPDLVESILTRGAHSAREIAEETMTEVRHRVGFN